MPRSPVITVRKAPKQERSRRLVEAILEAAARILEEGVEPFTTNHIALRAGASIGSLYQYFPSADAIMAALIEKHVADERESSDAILSSATGGLAEVMRNLLVGYINAHADAPRLTARLHALAPGFNLHVHLGRARDAQAAQLALALQLPKADVQMAVMAIEGVVLATLASRPRRLRANDFVDKLYSMALAPLVLQSNQGDRAEALRTPRPS